MTTFFFWVAKKSHDAFLAKKWKTKKSNIWLQMQFNPGCKKANLGHRWQMCQEMNSEQENKMWFYEFLLLLRVDQKTLLSVSKQKQKQKQNRKFTLNKMLNSSTS